MEAIRPKSPKEPYRPPRLIVYGGLERLTRGAPGLNTDNNGTSKQ